MNRATSSPRRAHLGRDGGLEEALNEAYRSAVIWRPQHRHRLDLLAGFMVMGFVLIYLRDFAPGAEEWAASYGEGTHFETRLAHVHGALFALVNVAVGLLLPRMPGTERQRSLVAGFAIAGMLMPLGILAEVLVGLPPILVIIGGVSILASMSLATVIWFRSVYLAAPESAASDAPIAR